MTDEQFTLYQGDCLDVLPTLEAGSIDAVICDPPYPDYYTELYGAVDLSVLDRFPCRQLIFWSAKADFPLSYTAIHVWDKKTGAGSQYERIFERNGGKIYRVFRHYLINSIVAANMTRDLFVDHPSQKPTKLMRELITLTTKRGGVVLDPFMGSGTTGLACANVDRRFIGIERDADYFATALERITTAYMPLRRMEVARG